MLLDRRFCLKTLAACNHEPGVTLRVIASNGWQTRTLQPVGSQRGLTAATKGVRNDVAPVRLSGGYEPDTPSRSQRHADLSSPTPVADSRDDQRF